MTQIAAIESVGPDRRGRRILLSDGTERTTSAAVVRALGLEPGGESATLEGELTAAEPEHARERALQLLGYRERSTAELRRRLLDDGYPQSVISEIVEAYVRVGLLDDARFAQMFSRTKVGSGYGRSRILRELQSKGIEPDLAQQTLDAITDDDSELQRAKIALRGAVPASRKERERLLRRLITRGFSMDVALRALRADVADGSRDE